MDGIKYIYCTNRIIKQRIRRIPYPSFLGPLRVDIVSTQADINHLGHGYMIQFPGTRYVYNYPIHGV